MSNLVRCKACGYIMDGAKVSDFCPACGVPAKQFEPFDDRIKEERRRILDLHIHPVIVHAPQAFALSLILLPIGLVVAAGDLRNMCLDTARLMGAALPITVLAAFIAGIFDGKIRFRKTNTPLLKKKKFVGGLFFVISLAICTLSLFTNLEDLGPIVAFEGLALLAMGCGAWLGFVGTPLAIAKFPG